ncbi:type II toxin-antitoxin system VapC family toxin [Avibacterium paragallinarum]|uniref:type II toxin-antitoxin system VapC family toxin n=1 Tax=Avibacterium TaxID=292486 RepID=UPI00397E24E6
MYLLDTNIISELYKFRNGKINAGVKAWLAEILPSETAISCITLSEIQTGILLKARRDKAQAALLNEWFKQQIIPVYQQNTLPITAEIALMAAELHIPNKMDINDAYIAATAKFHRLKLVTRNVKDFENCGIEIINPFLD